MKNNIVFSIVLLSVISFFVFLSSCQEPANPKALITVIGEDQEPIEGATVVIRAPTDTAQTMIYLIDAKKPIADTSYTDRNGEVSKTFRHEAIYRVEVIAPGNPFTRRGIGALILEKGKTYETTITVNEQTVF